MIQIDDTLVSLDVIERYFLCDLSKCKGECCVEGDSGAPLEDSELAKLQKAYREGKTDFYKPVSCHLYPIRVTQYRDFKAVNYHRWSVCKAAEILGKKEQLPVYKFLKEPLIRKFGQAWYKALEECAEEWKKQREE